MQERFVRSRLHFSQLCVRQAFRESRRVPRNICLVVVSGVFSGLQALCQGALLSNTKCGLLSLRRVWQGLHWRTWPKDRRAFRGARQRRSADETENMLDEPSTACPYSISHQGRPFIMPSASSAADAL